MRTKQAMWSDWGKRAKPYKGKKPRTQWQYRTTDVQGEDELRGGHYITRHRKPNKVIYIYGTAYKKAKWKSYGRKYK